MIKKDEKLIGAGAATIGLAGAGASIGIVQKSVLRIYNNMSRNAHIILNYEKALLSLYNKSSLQNKEEIMALKERFTSLRIKIKEVIISSDAIRQKNIVECYNILFKNHKPFLNEKKNIQRCFRSFFLNKP